MGHGSAQTGNTRAASGGAALTETSGAERRVHGRLRGEGASCSLGTIVDISAGGMRLLGSRPIRGKQRIVFSHPERGRMSVPAEVMWCRRVGSGSYAAGLRFLDISSNDRRDILSVRLHSALSDSGASSAPRGGAAAGWGVLALALAGAGAVVLGALSGGLEDSSRLARFFSDLSWDDGVKIGLVAMCLGAAALLVRGAGSKRRAAPATGVVGQAPPDVLTSLLESQSVLRSLLRSSLDGVVFVREIEGSGASRRTQFEFQLVNPAAESLLGASAETLLGTVVSADLPVFRELDIAQAANEVWESGLPLRRERRIGESDRWVLLTIIRVAKGLLMTFTDVSEQRRARENLHKAAYTCPLTGLVNRARLLEVLGDALHRSGRIEGYRFAVMFLDFDRFKVINDSLGHSAGDALLASIADRLRRHFGVSAGEGPGNPVVLARLGGDEFVILIDRVEAEGQVLDTAESLTRELAQPHQISGHSVVSTASIGVVVVSGSHASPEAILRDADIAMYAAKEAGKGRWVLFDQRMHAAALRRLELEGELRTALSRGDFSLVFEPMVAVEDGRVFAVEALIRWNHPRRGPVPPVEFLPLADELGLMPEIGRWVLAQACQHARAMNAGRPPERRTVVTVNVSRSELLRPSLAGEVLEVVSGSGVEPSLVCVEIPETHLTIDHKRVKELLAELKRGGVLVALDDFGTGHSSLHAVQELAIDLLKIDRSLLTTEGGMLRNAAVINAVMELSRHLGLSVVAEGIENPDQVALLQSLGCAYAQGRLFGPARPAGAFEETLDLERLRRAA